MSMSSNLAPTPVMHSAARWPARGPPPSGGPEHVQTRTPVGGEVGFVPSTTEIVDRHDPLLQPPFSCTDARSGNMVAVVELLRFGSVILAAVVVVSAQGTSAPPRFDDYPTHQRFEGKPAAPKLDSPNARLYRTRIREGVEKGWGVYDGTAGPERPGPNFAGHYIVIRWGCGSPCIQMAVVDADTGNVYPPPISANNGGFALPLLTLGNRVSRIAEIDFRLNSRLMVVKATPVQSASHPSY